jgi:hypothetical protein
LQNEFSIAGYWSGDADEAQFAAWCRDLCSKLHPHPVSLGLVFISPRYFSVAEKLLDILRVEARIPWLVGCSGNSLVSGEREIEEEAGISVGLFFFPDTQLEAIRFNQEQVEEWNGAGYWHLETGRTLETVQSWLVFADPFTLNSELWLRQWNDAFPGVPILGGLASGDYAARKTQIYCNGKVYEDGGRRPRVLGRGGNGWGYLPGMHSHRRGLDDHEDGAQRDPRDRQSARLPGPVRNSKRSPSLLAGGDPRQSLRRVGDERVSGRLSAGGLSDSEYFGGGCRNGCDRDWRPAEAGADAAVSSA